MLGWRSGGDSIGSEKFTFEECILGFGDSTKLRGFDHSIAASADQRMPLIEATGMREVSMLTQGKSDAS